MFKDTLSFNKDKQSFSLPVTWPVERKQQLCNQLLLIYVTWLDSRSPHPRSILFQWVSPGALMVPVPLHLNLSLN